MINNVDLDYPVIQASGPKYAEKVKNIYEMFGCQNIYNFKFGRLTQSGTVYFIQKGSVIVNCCSISDLDEEIRKNIILAKDF